MDWKKKGGLHQPMRNEQAVRIRITPHLMKRFKIVCIHQELSIAKQTEALIRSFVENQEDYISKVQEAKRKIGTVPKDGTIVQ
jgi:hypothetical protein